MKEYITVQVIPIIILALVTVFLIVNERTYAQEQSYCVTRSCRNYTDASGTKCVEWNCSGGSIPYSGSCRDRYPSGSSACERIPGNCSGGSIPPGGHIACSSDGSQATYTVNCSDGVRIIVRNGPTCCITCDPSGDGGGFCDFPPPIQGCGECRQWSDYPNCRCEQVGCSPIVVDTLGNGFDLTALARGVGFDLNGDGISSLLFLDLF